MLSPDIGISWTRNRCRKSLRRRHLRTKPRGNGREMVHMLERSSIPIGRQNAISRWDLASIYGCSERDIRRSISILRSGHDPQGYAILSSSTAPAGYWRSKDPDELRAFIAENEGRARSVFAAVREAKYLLRESDLREQFVVLAELDGGDAFA